MWYECIPSFAIITAAFYLPYLGLYNLHKVVLDNPYRRTMITRTDRINYQRDERLSGNSYVVKGLENLPDEK